MKIVAPFGVMSSRTVEFVVENCSCTADFLPLSSGEYVSSTICGDVFQN